MVLWKEWAIGKLEGILRVQCNLLLLCEVQGFSEYSNRDMDADTAYLHVYFEDNSYTLILESPAYTVRVIVGYGRNFH